MRNLKITLPTNFPINRLPVSWQKIINLCLVRAILRNSFQMIFDAIECIIWELVL